MQKGFKHRGNHFCYVYISYLFDWQIFLPKQQKWVTDGAICATTISKGLNVRPPTQSEPIKTCCLLSQIINICKIDISQVSSFRFK